MKNYYEEIIESINQTIKNEKFEEALKLIDEELNAPYIPIDVEKVLESLKNTVLNEISNKRNAQQNWNIDKVLEVMAKKIDQNFHLVAFSGLRNLNARLILDEIKTYLQDPEINGECKTFLLMVLIEQSIDEEIKIKKKNEEFLINPAKYDLIEAQSILAQVELNIEELIYNVNPSLFAICQNIASAFFYDSFPNLGFRNYNLKDVSNAIILKGSQMLNLDSNEYLELKTNFNKENTTLILEELDKII